MMETPESGKIHLGSSDYFAVRPDLVLRAAHAFSISSSILERGAKKLYSRAVAVQAGKEMGRWGRHQLSVLEQFCTYTQTVGSPYLLPWQELVEHRVNYDGKEGISPRTGNKPLSTVNRLTVNTDALIASREDIHLSVEALAKQCQLPVVLLSQMEKGCWPDVAEATATRIAKQLNQPLSNLFQPIQPPLVALPENIETKEGTNEPAVAKSEQAESTANQQQPPAYNTIRSTTVPADSRIRWLAGLTLLSMVIVVTMFFFQDIFTADSTHYFDQQALVGSRWQGIIIVVNNNIPILEKDIALKESWANGGYLELKPGGQIGFNWIDPNFPVDLPEEFSWTFENSQLSFYFGDLIYRFDLGNEQESYRTLNTTRAFEMTIYPLL